MRKSRLLWLCSLCLLFSGMVFADSVPAGDPVIQVDDPNCEEGCQQVSSQQEFRFFANDAGGGTTNFQIVGNLSFTTIDIETVGIFNSIEDVQCISDKLTCQVSFLNGVTDMFFTANSCGEFSEFCSVGYPVGDIFSVDLDNFDTPGIGGWGAGREFVAIANITQPTSPRIPTPEPSSLLLLPAGALLVNRWKHRKGSVIARG